MDDLMSYVPNVGGFLSGWVELYCSHFLLGTVLLTIPLFIITQVLRCYLTNADDLISRKAKKELTWSYGQEHDINTMLFFGSCIPIIGYLVAGGFFLSVIIPFLSYKKQYETVVYFLPVAMLGLLWIV